ncbi:hypothetical protein D3C79_950150 [compost metagenome]
MKPLGADIAAHVDIAALHGLLQAQACQYVILRAYTRFPGNGLHQVEQQTLHRFVAFDAHQRHAPALGDGKTQHRLFGQAVGGPEQ